MPYFSIIIPALNEERYLPLLLEDLSQQTFKNFEVIVSNGKSTDHTEDKALSFKNKLSLTLVNTSKNHVSLQRNQGAKKAKGRILVFFDADTRVNKNYLKNLKNGFETKKPHVATSWIEPDDNSQIAKLIAISTNMLFETIKFLGIPGVYGGMIAVRKKVFEDLGGFDEKSKFGEDAQFIQLAVKQNYKFIIFKKFTYQFSLRRFRSEGTLEVLLQYLRLNLATLKNGPHGPHPKYPMGGHLFPTTSKTSHSLKWLEATTKKIQATTQQQRQKLTELLQELFNDPPQLNN